MVELQTQSEPLAADQAWISMALVGRSGHSDQPGSIGTMPLKFQLDPK